MQNNLPWMFILCLSQISCGNAFSYGHLGNFSLIASPSNSTTVNGSCADCLCQMVLSNGTITSFNCFTTNNTCQLYPTFALQTFLSGVNNSAQSFYFDSSITSFLVNLSMQSNPSTNSLFDESTADDTSTTSQANALVSFTYNSFNCSSLTKFIVHYDKSNIPSSWTTAAYIFNATSKTTTILFGLQSNNERTVAIDNVTVVAVSNPTQTLLINGDFQFENLTGWHLQSCSSGCTSDVANDVTPVSNYFYHDPLNCSGYQFLQQSFESTANQNYKLSFAIAGFGTGKGNNDFDVKVSIT